MAADPSVPVPSAPLVAAVGWVVPGGGYWLLGERPRAATVGVSILALFVIGLLVGGVRVIEVPGYRVETGQRVVDPATRRWVLQVAPLNEVRNKPWSLPQLMVGPVAVAAGAWSVAAAVPDADGHAAGVLTHARVNEIGSLYLSVAGLLNLMAIIDAAHRAVHRSEAAARARGARAVAP